MHFVTNSYTHCHHIHITSSLLNWIYTANEGLPQTCHSPLSANVRHIAQRIQATTGQNVHSRTRNVLDDLGEGCWWQQIGLWSLAIDQSYWSGQVNKYSVIYIHFTNAPHLQNTQHTLTDSLQLPFANPKCFTCGGYNNIEAASNPPSIISCIHYATLMCPNKG